MVYALNITEKFVPAKKINSIGGLLNFILPLLTFGASLIFLIMILKAAFNWLSHGDNPEVLKKAQATFFFAVFGLIVVIVSFVAVQLIGKILGIEKLI